MQKCNSEQNILHMNKYYEVWSNLHSSDLNHSISDCWSATKTMLTNQTSLVTLAETMEGKQVRLFAQENQKSCDHVNI